MSEELRLDVVTVAHSKGLTDAARDVEKLKGETDKLGESFTGLTDETEHWSEETRKGTVDAKSLNAELEKSRKGVKGLEAQLVEMGNDPALRKELRSQRSWLSELERIEKELAAVDKAAQRINFEAPARDTRTLNEELVRTRLLVGNLERGAAGDVSLLGDLKRARADLKELEKAAKEVKLPDLSLAGVMGGKPRSSLLRMLGKDNWSIGKPQIGDLSGLQGVLMPGLIGLAAAASPAIGAMVSGAVVGAVGVGGIVGGIVAASSDPRVGRAWRDFASGMSPDSFGRQAFAEPTVAGIAEISKAFADIHIGDAISKGADAVPILARGIGDFARNLMPGFNAVMGQSTGIANIFAAGLADVGDSLSDMLTDIMNSPGTMEGFQVLFSATGDVIRATGATLQWFGDRFDEMARIAGPMSGAMEDIWGWVPLAGPALRKVNDVSERLIGTGGDLAYTLHHVSDETRVATGQMDPFTYYLKEAWGRTAQLKGELLATSEALHGLIDTQLSFDQAIVAMEQGFTNVKETIKQNGRHWTDNTVAAQNNQAALFAQIGTLEQLRVKQIEATGDVKGANAEFDAQVEALLAIAKAAGASKEWLDKVAGTYEIKLILTAILPAVQGATQLAGDAFRKVFNFGGPRASGGPVEAGKGYLVGERGPEPFVPSTNGTIMPNSSLSSMGGGKLQFTMVGTGDRLVDAILEALRLRITANGGLEATFN